jgi:hypothetical protein
LLEGSKGSFGVLVAVHGVLPLTKEQEDHSQHSAAAANGFPRERGTRQKRTFIFRTRRHRNSGQVDRAGPKPGGQRRNLLNNRAPTSRSALFEIP